MEKIKKILGITVVTTMLTACAANPHVVKVQKGNEQYLNCSQIDEQIQTAVRLKVESRKEDRFQFKYMMPLTAVMSVININRAESAAKKRIKYLEQVKMQKRCPAQAMYNAGPGQMQQPGGMNPYGGQQFGQAFPSRGGAMPQGFGGQSSNFGMGMAQNPMHQAPSMPPMPNDAMPMMGMQGQGAPMPPMQAGAMPYGMEQGFNQYTQQGPAYGATPQLSNIAPAAGQGGYAPQISDNFTQYGMPVHMSDEQLADKMFHQGSAPTEEQRKMIKQMMDSQHSTPFMAAGGMM